LGIRTFTCIKYERTAFPIYYTITKISKVGAETTEKWIFKHKTFFILFYKEFEFKFCVKHHFAESQVYCWNPESLAEVMSCVEDVVASVLQLENGAGEQNSLFSGKGGYFKDVL
jgi:hypothetical protein